MQGLLSDNGAYVLAACAIFAGVFGVYTVWLRARRSRTRRELARQTSGRNGGE